MVNAIWLPLWQLLDVPNSLVVLSVIVCLFTLVSFILRLETFFLAPVHFDPFNSKYIISFHDRLSREDMEGGPGSSCVFMPSEPAEMRLTYQSSPLNLIISEPNENHKQDFDSGIKIAINTRSSFWFSYYWGPDINSFHARMVLDWRMLKTEVVNESYLKEGDKKLFLESVKPELIFEKHKEILIKPNSIKVDDLGPSPRSRFPLLVVLFVNEDDLEKELAETDTVALFSVIHVKDKFCPMDSNFVFKLNKMANNQVLNVRDLYARSNDIGEGLCLICETEEIEVALLPCKHLCVCEECFGLLPHPKQCPICRSYVTTFFKHKKGAAPYGNAQPMVGGQPVITQPPSGPSANDQTNPSGEQPSHHETSASGVTGGQQKKPWFKKMFSRS